MRRLGRLIFTAALIIILALVTQRTWAGYAPYGLFRGLGVDFGDYWAQTMVLRMGDPTRLYDVQAVNEYLELLRVYTPASDQSLLRLPTPYPPLFAWLFTPFTWPSPPTGFMLWTMLNIVGAVYLGWRLSTLFPHLDGLTGTLLVLVSFPALWALINGQVVLLLACAVTEGYLALRQERDFRAGLWLACLLLKPQYSLLLLPLLMVKRRWTALTGVATGGAIIVIGSALFVGLPSLLTFPSAILLQSSTGNISTTAPRVMINWRALLFPFASGLGEGTTLVLTLLLGLLTVLALIPIWRGRWFPRSPHFPVQMTLLWLATLLVSFHSHAHGAVLLTLPVASALAEGGLSRASRIILLTTAYAPTLYWLIFTFPRTYWAGVFNLFTGLLLLCFACLWYELVVRPQSADHDTASPSSSVAPTASLA